MSRKTTIPQLLAIAWALCLLLTGCRTGQPADNAAPAAPPLTGELRSGPLTVQLTLSSPRLSIADHLQLTLTATAPEDFVVSFPEFTTSVGDFTLAGTASPPRELIGGQIRQSRLLILAPYLPGQYTIPEMKISARDKQQADSQAEVTVPGRTIPVTSLLDSGENDPQPADIYPPLAQPLPMLYYLLAGGGVAAVCALLLFFYRGNRRQKPPPPPLPPHAAALAAIDRLLQEQADDGDPARFYHRLSAILRRYIEARFGLRAPEQTTEEFLDALRHSPLFSGEQKELLRGFLGRCDLIKFARIVPARQEMEAGIELCRGFIRTSGEKMARGADQDGAP